MCDSCEHLLLTYFVATILTAKYGLCWCFNLLHSRIGFLNFILRFIHMDFKFLLYCRVFHCVYIINCYSHVPWGKRETTLMGSKAFNKSPHNWVANWSELQDKDSRTLIFLTAPSRDRSGVYKHKKHKHLLPSYSYNFHQSGFKVKVFL